MGENDFDLIVIGGGITGAGLFHKAASLGLKVLLLEKGSAGAQTTGSSSGLIHGGLRYLPYDVSTSLLCCREAGALQRLYPDLLKRQVFLWTVYRSDRYWIELVEALLEYYDRFAGLKGGKPHLRLTPAETLELDPAIEPRGLAGAVTFDEWAVDAVALVRRLLEDGRRQGGVAREGMRVTRFELRNGAISAVRSSDRAGEESAASGRVVVNATGPWAEQIARLAGCRSVGLVLRKGVHLVLEESPVRHGLIFQDSTGRMIGL
jgi:glycerol-3-phosphate dehydrogenase